MSRPADRAAAQDGQARPRARILVAGERVSQDALRLLLERHVVEAVSDGRKALAAARERKPDIVIYGPAPGDNFDLVTALRSDPAVDDVLITVLSPAAGEDVRIEGFENGANDVIDHPASARELLARVEARLRAAVRGRRSEAQRATRASTEARQKQALLATVVARMPVGVGVTDRDGRIILSNAELDRYVGSTMPSEDEARYGRFRGYHPDGRRIERNDYPGRRALRGEEEAEAEFLYRHDDGTETWKRVTAVPLRDGGGQLTGALMLIQDIDAAKRGNEALQEADRRKDEFIATLSHELRNPLAALRSALELLRLDEKADALTSSLQPLMQRQVMQLVRLVDDLMEMSRVNRGELVLRTEAVEAGAVVKAALETIAPLIRSARHEISLSLPERALWLNGDPLRLGQVLANLLHNAVRYTEPGGRIRVTVQQAGEQVAIAVSDNGIGIAPQALPRVFNMFGREGRGRGHGQEGLGIGLALAQRLVEMHGGSIQAASGGPGRGSTFTVLLPLLKVHGGAAAAQQRNERPGKLHQRILVVDDNRDVAHSLSKVLELLGAEVRVANDGAQALETFSSYHPEVVLLDIGMPEMDGYEVARRLRQGKEGRQAAIVALTGWGQEQDRRRVREAGFDHHLVKPVAIAALQSLLSRLEARSEPR